MKKLLVCFLILCFLGGNSYCIADSVLVPANISIYLTPTNTITSKENNIDKIDAIITENVIVNNTIIFKAGDRATLHIEEIEKAHCWGNPGKLFVNNGYAYNVKGDKHKILISRNYYGDEKLWPKACGVASLFLLLPLALFGFVHGGQAIVSASSEIETTLASQFNFEK